MCVYSSYSICFPSIKIVDNDNYRNKVSSQNFSTVFTFETFQTTMPPKRKRTYLSDTVKYDIIKMRDGGVPRKIIEEKYGAALSTITNLRAQRSEIITRFETNTMKLPGTSRNMSSQKMKDLEGILYHWYIQCRTHNIKITAVQIKEKALEINKKLNINPKFKGGLHWARNFRIRHGITEEDILLDFPNVTAGGERTFRDEFNKRVNNKECTLDNIYNVVYVPIMWKLVPEKTEIFKRATSTGNQEMCEDHVTALFCVNASGCHKLPILIIGSEVINRRLYNFKTSIFSTIYKSKSNAWMDSTIFNDWFEHHFLKSVREKQEKGKRAKTVLLLDNTRLLFDLKNLNEKDEFVTVESIPNDVSQFVQPICSGIILCFMRKYRRELAKILEPLAENDKEDEVIDNHKDLSMWDCCRIVHRAWSKVDDVVIRRAWDRLLRCTNMCLETTKEEKRDISKTCQSLSMTPGCKSCDEDDVIKWFQVDKIDKIVMKVYTDEAIRDFESNTMGVDIVDNLEDGPSHSPAKKAYIVRSRK
jgi:uncharacterized protein (DUF433 family)